MLDRLLADVVVIVHFGYLAFIPFGGFLAWRWRRLLPLHFAATAVGFVSIAIGFDCPLTSWEKSLRRSGGEQPYKDGFVDHYVKGRIVPHGHDAIIQLVILLAVLSAYIGLVLMRRARSTGRPPASVSAS